MYTIYFMLYLIEILHQTTTWATGEPHPKVLYLIEILHQTTTSRRRHKRKKALYLIEILHQTTTLELEMSAQQRCILSKFYIKPQLRFTLFFQFIVVSYRNSTSNHNSPWHAKLTTKLYLIEILHQTTTLSRSEVNTHKLYLIEILHQTTTASTVNPMRSRCILSKFYIKPQHGRTCFGYNRVVSYRNSTSNHNILTLRSGSIMLYLIEILHQTTTSSMP